MVTKIFMRPIAKPPSMLLQKAKDSYQRHL
jgi:hypothetical protein